MILLFVRHAESQANAGLVTSDPKTISITKAGRYASQVLAESINTRPDLIIVSSFIRTQQTAEPLKRKYPHVQVEVWPIHEFTYLSPKQCLNTTAKDRLTMVTEYWDRCDPGYIHGPGAESFNQFYERVSKSLAMLKGLKRDYVIIFSHSQVIQLIQQVVENGYQPSLDAMTYFVKEAMKRKLKNTEVVTFTF